MLDVGGDYDLQTRIRAHAGDMWTNPFPPADVHFYSMIYHDWTPKNVAFMSENESSILGSVKRNLID
jgi:O-methyltransferase domain